MLTFSSSFAGAFDVAFEWLINGTLLECAEIFALAHVVFIPSRLTALSTLSKHCFAVVVVILLFAVDVINSFVPAFKIMFGGSVRSFVESSFRPSRLSLFSDSGGDGVGFDVIVFGGDKRLFLK